MLTAVSNQRGLTLVELMVAGAISLIALSALLSVYSTTIQHPLAGWDLAIPPERNVDREGAEK